MRDRDREEDGWTDDRQTETNRWMDRQTERQHDQAEEREIDVRRDERDLAEEQAQ